MSDSAQLLIEPSGVARVDGALTLGTVAELYKQAAMAARDGRKMQSLDLGAVSHVDSSGLALVLEWQSEAVHGGRKLSIVDAPADLLSLANLCEASELLTMDGRDT